MVARNDGNEDRMDRAWKTVLNAPFHFVLVQEHHVAAIRSGDKHAMMASHLALQKFLEEMAGVMRSAWQDLAEVTESGLSDEAREEVESHFAGLRESIGPMLNYPLQSID